MLLGAGRFGTAVPLLGIGLWVNPTVLAVLPAASDQLGYAEVALPIPNSAAFADAQLYGQFLWPSACGAQGLSASNAVDLIIQP